MLGSFFRKATSSRVSPSTWDPSIPLPLGSTSVHELLKLPIGSHSHVSFRAEGAWSHGTVVFESRENIEPPSYDMAVSAMAAADAKRAGPQLGDGQAFLEVSVHARFNDEELFNEAKVDFRKDGENVELVIFTPGMSPSRIASQLSFHVTFSFPPTITIVAGLRTSGSQWRTLGLASLASVYFGSASLSTVNTPISFVSLRAGKTSIDTVNAKIDGQYACESLRAKTANAPIAGTYFVDGECELYSTNGGINAEVKAGNLVVHDSNAKIEGTFAAQDGLNVETQNAAVGGTFACPGGVRLSTSNAQITGSFRVGKELVLKTSNAKIDVKVSLVGDDREGSLTPPLFPNDKKSLDDRYVSGKVDVKAQTSNAIVLIDFVEHPRGLLLLAECKSSNAEVTIAHSPSFAGQFDLSTSNAVVTVDVPSGHTVTFQTKSRTHSRGTIATAGLETGSELKLKTSNAAVKLVI